MRAVRIDRITLIVSNLDRAEDDYVTTFGCAVEQRDAVECSLTSVLGIPEARGRRSLLRLGRERIELLEFADSMGRLYPCDSTSTDIWFQHMAIVVTDISDAHQRVMSHPRFRPISRAGPVQLPGASGGVTAFKFRDRDGHPLELIAFPEARNPAEWHGAGNAAALPRRRSHRYRHQRLRDQHEVLQIGVRVQRRSAHREPRTGAG
jgi:catechol 2,3-dioxygenase-like lactoylglutathione lyase family enzyme